MGENLNKNNYISYSWIERLSIRTYYPQYTQCSPHPNLNRLSMLKIDKNDSKVYVKKKESTQSKFEVEEQFWIFMLSSLKFTLKP